MACLCRAARRTHVSTQPKRVVQPSVRVVYYHDRTTNCPLTIVYRCSKIGRPGRSCTYDKYNVGCTKCARGLVGLDNRTCQRCSAGHEPNSLHTACVACAAGKYADAESLTCHPCQKPGQRPNEARTDCETPVCHELDSVYSSTLSRCVCPAGYYNISRCVLDAVALTPSRYWLQRH